MLFSRNVIVLLALSNLVEIDVVLLLLYQSLISVLFSISVITLLSVSEMVGIIMCMNEMIGIIIINEVIKN